MPFKFTLLADGTSDRTLLPILTWTLREHLTPSTPVEAKLADFSRLIQPPKMLSEKIVEAQHLNPSELLFIHRDAETATITMRHREIESAIVDAAHIAKRRHVAMPAHICVVPVRMTEAWLLLDIRAIRTAAGNPRGLEVLSLPGITRVEKLPNPKDVLFKALRTASGLRTRRRKQLDVERLRHDVASYMTEHHKLRSLSAFQRLERDVHTFCSNRVATKATDKLKNLAL